MKLTKNQNMQQRKNPAAADGIIIKNHAQMHPAPELSESITQLISTKICTQLTEINCIRIYQNRTAASGEQKPPEKNRRHPPENVKNRLTTMCRNSVEASDKTGKAKRESRMQEPEALENCTVLHKIGQRIELQNPNGRQNRLGFNKVTTVACRLSTGVKSEKKDKGGKTEPDTSSAEALPSCRCTFLLLIFVTHSINEIGNITGKNERKQKNLHPRIVIFLKKNPSTRDTRQASPKQNGGKIVSKKKNGLPYHFRLDPKIPGKLDAVITRMGYASRGAYFNAVAQFTVKKFGNETANKDGAAKVPDLPPELKAWITEQKPPLTEDEIKTHLEEQIRNLLFPVLSLKGVDITHESAWKDVRSRFREEHGMWLTESDIRVAIEEFASVHHGELTDYRNKTLEGEQL